MIWLNQQSFDDNSDRKSRSKLVHQDNGGGGGRGRDPLVKIMLNDSIQIDDDDDNDDYINRNLKG